MRFGTEKFKNWFSIFSETVKDRVMPFSVMIDISIGVADRGLSISAITSGRHRKGKKKIKFSKLIFQIKTYITLLGLFQVIQTIDHTGS
jgi:hypothetical protein